MPATLSHLSRNKSTFTHEFEDGTSVTITYRPGRITPRQLHRVQEFEARPDRALSQEESLELMDETTRLLASALIDWDMQDDETHELIPPTFEGLQDVDYEAQQIVMEWIVEDQRLGKSNGTGPSPVSSTRTSESKAPVPMIPSSRRSRTSTTNTTQRSG
jgi:hypothetical protein